MKITTHIEVYRHTVIYPFDSRNNVFNTINMFINISLITFLKFLKIYIYIPFFGSFYPNLDLFRVSFFH